MRYRVIQYLIWKLSDMVFMRQEGLAEVVLLASVRASWKVTIYYINGALLKLNRNSSDLGLDVANFLNDFRYGTQPPPEPIGSPIALSANEVGHSHHHHHHESFSSTRSGQILWIRGLTRLQTQVGQRISQLIPAFFHFFFHIFLYSNNRYVF